MLRFVTSRDSETPTMTGRIVIRTLSKARCLFAMLFIPVVLLHLAWITPVVEWSCFCPDDEPNHRCCCNCPKCVNNRGGFKSYCHLTPKRIEETQIAKGSSIADLFSGQDNAALSDNSVGRPGLLTCECDSHIKKISLDIQPFLPQPVTLVTPPFPIVGGIATDDWRPPEAIPCQPASPG